MRRAGQLVNEAIHEQADAAAGDKAAAAATRAKVLDMVATDGVMVAGMHLDFPGFGYVERAKQGYGFIAAPWDYRI